MDWTKTGWTKTGWLKVNWRKSMSTVKNMAFDARVNQQHNFTQRVSRMMPEWITPYEKL